MSATRVTACTSGGRCSCGCCAGSGRRSHVREQIGVVSRGGRLGSGGGSSFLLLRGFIVGSKLS